MFEDEGKPARHLPPRQLARIFGQGFPNDARNFPQRQAGTGQNMPLPTGLAGCQCCDMRLRLGVELNPYNRSTFYGGDARGYTDYPT